MFSRILLSARTFQIDWPIDARLNNFPFEGSLSDNYLHALYMFDCSEWNAGIHATRNDEETTHAPKHTHVMKRRGRIKYLNA